MRLRDFFSGPLLMATLYAGAIILLISFLIGVGVGNDWGIAVANGNDCCKECKICEEAQALTWPPKKGVYLVLLGDAIDGDTFRFFYLVEDTGRLAGLQAPEIKMAGGPEAKAFLQSKMPVKPTLLRIHSREKYGRALTTMWPMEIVAGLNSKALPKIPCPSTTINKQMIDAGHAKPWDGRGARP